MLLTLNNLIIKLFFIIGLVYGVVVQDKPSPKHQTSLHLHQTKKVLLHDRHLPQKCDLICPGEPPLALPPNFIQNCSSTARDNSTRSTTRTPSTSTASNEESNETDGSSEESGDTSTEKTTGRTIKNENTRHQRTKGINSSSQVRKRLESKQYKNKKHIRKEKVLLKREVKKILVKRNKRLKGRNRLDGCYVVCSDTEGVEPGGPGNSGNQAEANPNDSTAEESDEDPYIPGEDIAIEVLYIPEQTHDNQRPVDLHQIMPSFPNYAFLEPQPALEYGFDSFFMEGKQNKLKNRKQKNRRKENRLSTIIKGDNRHKHKQTKK